MLLGVHLLLAFYGVSLSAYQQSETMQSKIETGSFEFSLALYNVLKSADKNLVVSPFSLTSALAMSLIGSRGKTGHQLSQTLFGHVIPHEHYDSVAEEFNSLVDKSIKANEKVLSVANFMYSHVKYPILSEFNQTLEKKFSAKIKEVDFTKTSEAIATINKDISDATKKKIPNLLEGLDPLTRLVLANAVYFKGLWKTQFKPNETKKNKFTLSNGEQVDVDMMYQKTKLFFGYSEELNCRALELPYEDSNVGMVLLLPEEDSTIESLEAKLSTSALSNLFDNMHQVKVSVYLPRFKLESSLHLVPALSKLGIADAFNEDADFSGITNDPQGLYIGDVIQKAVIEVNEEGTEAAAASAAVFLTRSLDIPEEFKADRPFIFMLISRDEQSKLVLFMGSVKNPKT